MAARTSTSASTTWCLAAAAALLLLQARPADGSLSWRRDDNGLDDGDPGCSGTWSCLRADLADGLGKILASEQYNVTPALAVERVVPAAPGDRMDVDASLNEAGLPTLAATAIKLFESHALVWRLWPGVMHLKIFRSPTEGMDAAVELPPSPGGRTWGLAARIGARRRLTMALLPIMYKMGVGTTLLGVLVFLALKTAFMVSILFVLAVGSLLKHKFGGGGAVAQPVYYAPPQAPHHKEVHVHVHADKQAYGGWHRYGAHHGHQDYHPVYPPSPYHSGPPPSDEGYYESEAPASYYHHHPHRRTGYPGLLTASSAQHAPLRWDFPGAPAAPAAAAAAAEPAYYTGSYAR